MIICAGLAAAARTRRRYPARTSRSTGLPRGSPYPRSAEAAWVHACLMAQAQSVRGKLDRSGTPGWKSAISGGSGGWRPGEGAGGEDHGRAGHGLVTGVLAADAGDPGGGPGAAGQVSLGQQLPVAVLHHAAGDAELTRQLPRGRQPFPGAEPAAPDRLAQARLQLGAQRLAGRTVEPDQQPRTQTGPLNRHEIGPYQRAGWLLACVL